MPTKLGKGGHGSQNYVPAGNGDASGEYGDNATGSNIHYFQHFKKPDLEVKDSSTEKTSFKTFKTPKKSKKKKEETPKVEETTVETPKEETPKEEYTKVEGIKPSINKKVKAFDDTDCYDYLLGFEGEFDENKLKNLSSEELHNLVAAKLNTETKPYTSLKKDLKEWNDENKLWNNVPVDYSSLESSLKAKEDYFNKQLDYWELKDQTDWSDEKKQSAEGYVKNYKKGLENVKHVQDNFLPKWKQEEDTIKQSKELVDSYLNLDNVYSQSAKDKALWFKDSDAARKHFTPIAQEIYKTIPKEDLDKIKSYTGSYSFINEPLRKKHYVGLSEKKAKFLEHVEGMTKAIDKSVITENMWLQRGTSELNINGASLSSMSNDQIQQLVGKTFEDQGFVSCGTHKGAGFASNNYIMNIYCPKGTKALYVDPISQYSGSNENETIINRGYTYKITKVSKKGEKTYIDCEVVLNSDIKRYNSKELEELKDKYF